MIQIYSKEIKKCTRELMIEGNKLLKRIKSSISYFAFCTLCLSHNAL